MGRGRTPRQVAERALILGAIAFRASLEVTDHPRAGEASERLLPWLGETGCGDEIDRIERELLSTPLQQLSPSQRIDANWAGEAAAFYGWMLNLAGPLEETSPADVSDLLDNVLPILEPRAGEILRSPSLRDWTEIQDMCRHYLMIRSTLRGSRVGSPERDIVRSLQIQELKDVGVEVTQETIRRAAESVSGMTPQERERAAGLYFVRGHAAMWYLSDQSTYFEQ